MLTPEYVASRLFTIPKMSKGHSFCFKDFRSRARSRVSPLPAHCSRRPPQCEWLDVFPIYRSLIWLIFIISPIFSSMKLGMPSLLISGWLISSTQPQTRRTAVGPCDGWHPNLSIQHPSNWNSLAERLPAMFTPSRVLA